MSNIQDFATIEFLKQCSYEEINEMMKEFDEKLKAANRENNDLKRNLYDIKQSIKRCFPHTIAQDGCLLVRVDNYNHLANVCNKVSLQAHTDSP